jgi:hypothetical protein
MLRVNDGRVHDFILVFPVWRLQLDQIVESDLGQPSEKCLAMTRESNGAGAFRSRTFRKVSDRVAQCSLVNPLGNDR